ARFPATFTADTTATQLYEASNAITEPSLIRVESDEVTYPMHIILRYELEQGLVDGSVAVDDIPQLWNDKMEAYLGERPPNDAKGCLQ
ncbi:putative metalloprotease ypwA, partial [Tetrabaena socialis]